MQRHAARIWVLAALAFILPTGLAGSAGADQPPVAATVGASPTGQVMAPGFVGVSLEYGALHVYTGRDPKAVNPVLVQLLRNLAPGQAPVIRIGGNSTDATWWPIRGVIPPSGVRYSLTEGWLRMTRALASALGAHLIMGVNLAGGRPAIAAAEARAFIQGIGRRYLQALEIGNEPDVYNVFPWYFDTHGQAVFARDGSYDIGDFTTEFSRWRAALPSLPTAGPAFAELTWLGGLNDFLQAEPGLSLVTIHRYPLRACLTDQSSPEYPSIANLLSDQASSGLAQEVQLPVVIAHARGLPIRIDEMNSAACSGRKGVSDTFASALWALDVLFNMASVGVDGVNLHSLPGAAYELFTFKQTRGRWQAFVHPEYYGLLMFEQAFPPGARLLPVTAPSGPVKVWATDAPDGSTRIVLINKDPAASHQVQLQVPGSGSPATLEWLQAPSATATAGVSLGGEAFGSETSTGSLAAPPRTDPIIATQGTYTINLPPASAALLTQ